MVLDLQKTKKLNTQQIAKYKTGFAKYKTGFAKYMTKIARKLILYIKKFWSVIMNNEQLFNLTSPP